MFGLQIGHQFSLCRLFECNSFEMKVRLGGPAALDKFCRTFDLGGRYGAKGVCSNVLDCFVRGSHGYLFCRHCGLLRLDLLGMLDEYKMF